MLTILIGRARSGKSETVLRRIAELGDHSKQILLVPEHASHQAEIDLCRVCGDGASRHAEVLSFRRLADRVLSAVGGAESVTLDSGGKLLTLQRALTECAPMLRVYRRPSQKSGFLEQMCALFDELRTYEVTPETLEASAKAIERPTQDKLIDLALLYAAYEARLHRPNFDARDRMSKLCDRLEESGYVCGKDVFLDGFTYFNAQEYRVIEILARKAKSLTITLLGEKGSSEEIFHTSLKTLTRLQELAQRANCELRIETLTRSEGGALSHLEHAFFGEMTPYQGACDAICLREAESIYSEVERTAADIRLLVSQGKCRYRDITVATRDLAAYSSAIETIFERYDIPAYLSRRRSILEKPALTLLTGVLRAISNGYEYEDMFRCLKSGLFGLSVEECDLLEDFVIRWEIHGAMWLRDVDWTAAFTDDHGATREELARVNELRRRVREPLFALSEGLKAGETAREKVDALYDFMERVGLQKTLEEEMRVQTAAGRMQDAEETAQLWGILCGVLDQFVEILDDEKLSIEEFERLFRLVLTQYSVGTIPVSLDQVSVSEITRNDRHTSKYLYLLGVNDHLIPHAGETGGILNDDDREELSRLGVTLSPAGMERMSIELQNLYAALAQPTEGLTVSYPVSDVSGEKLRPAFVAERLLRIFPDLRTDREDGRHDYRLASRTAALERAGEERGGALWNYFEKQGECGDALSAMERAAQWKRGSLSRAAVRALYNDTFSMSASRAESLNKCHFAYFMQYGLGAKKREAETFDPARIGTFLHFLMDHVIADLTASHGSFADVEQKEVRALVRKYIDVFVKENIPNIKTRSARFRYLFARLREQAYAIAEEAVEELKCSDFVPLKTELSFGDKGDAIPAVVISEPDAEMRVRGKVDRVDGWVKDGKLYLRVVDYKSGKKKFDLGDVRRGLDIQMLLYLFTLQKEGKKLFGHEIEPAGVLYFPARDPILKQPRSVTPEALAKERETKLKRVGLLLRDPQVLTAMEHDSLKEAHYLPVKVSKDGTISGSLASAEELGRLGRYVETVLHRICAEICEGNIDADPVQMKKDGSTVTQCDYCDWAAACHFRDGQDTDRLRPVESVSPQEFFAELAMREKGDEQPCPKSN